MAIIRLGWIINTNWLLILDQLVMALWQSHKILNRQRRSLHCTRGSSRRNSCEPRKTTPRSYWKIEKRYPV